MKYKCRMCEKSVDWVAKPLDGLCTVCHLELCDKGIEKCSRCAQIINGLTDIIEENDNE